MPIRASQADRRAVGSRGGAGGPNRGLAGPPRPGEVTADGRDSPPDAAARRGRAAICHGLRQGDIRVPRRRRPREPLPPPRPRPRGSRLERGLSSDRRLQGRRRGHRRLLLRPRRGVPRARHRGRRRDGDGHPERVRRPPPAVVAELREHLDRGAAARLHGLAPVSRRAARGLLPGAVPGGALRGAAARRPRRLPADGGRAGLLRRGDRVDGRGGGRQGRGGGTGRGGQGGGAERRGDRIHPVPAGDARLDSEHRRAAVPRLLRRREPREHDGGAGGPDVRGGRGVLPLGRQALLLRWPAPRRDGGEAEPAGEGGPGTTGRADAPRRGRGRWGPAGGVRLDGHRRDERGPRARLGRDRRQRPDGAAALPVRVPCRVRGAGGKRGLGGSGLPADRRVARAPARGAGRGADAEERGVRGVGAAGGPAPGGEARAVRHERRAELSHGEHGRRHARARLPRLRRPARQRGEGVEARVGRQGRQASPRPRGARRRRRRR
mmetsp:Transcript_24385/g.55684  ORF Transcript_24385/g.55684 Transcript_24385/m.55684 type:complete len:494 (-) Transcript_24385:388-1869(-)